MPLVARWGSEVRTTSPLEPGSNDPRPLSLTGVPAPISLPDLSKVFPANTPKPLKSYDTASGGGRRRGGTVATPVDPPLAGLDINGAQVIPAPANGLDLDDATIIAPANGLDIQDAIVPAPANGLDINDTLVTPDKPAAGLDLIDALVFPPSLGLDLNDASVILPANGLDIDDTLVIPDAPAAGLDITAASVNPPVAGLDITDASVQSPVAGLDIDSAVIPTLNIEIVTSSDFALDPSTGIEGEIKYSSEDGFIWIHNGTEWYKTDGLPL
jgi:hypothetical protein